MLQRAPLRRRTRVLHALRCAATALAVLALLATLAQWVLYLVGQWAQDGGQHRYWQLSNRRGRAELSAHRLGWLIVSILDPPTQQLMQIIERWSRPNAALQI